MPGPPGSDAAPGIFGTAAVATPVYVLEVKASARRASARAGQWVADRGTTRSFDSKALARQWARECSASGRAVWVQDAVPWDESEADGYLVSGDRPGRPSVADGDEQSDL